MTKSVSALAVGGIDAHNTRMSPSIIWNGWLECARHCPSPNYNARPSACWPEMLVVHNISLPPGCFDTGDIEALFCNKLDCSRDPSFAELQGLEVSAHFLIDRNGVLTQFVSCLDRAWHAGVSSWSDRVNCNDFSIGIELEGTDSLSYEKIQYEVLSHLIVELRSCIPTLAPGPIVGHSDIAPGRKTDPGQAFDWARLRSLLRARNNPSARSPIEESIAR
ncbi:1,6-anhydro-N-acetylmuramyl-L-alanine amidase AmpD [Congregibacter variabilis]|uniref:1,6-anhydro-N-acetylmuramyl-L-alanine amidase AmpD n=1 Tax=Congregibacter variabilis TaxID=3081200 RepID=A0ABZ0I5X6_9GAMM|nr:1,6-anhydro-N-acetylmuramyl-L-alanine amidase AmpD [Congregibacter sp. IMCC43200]